MFLFGMHASDAFGPIFTENVRTIFCRYPGPSSLWFFLSPHICRRSIRVSVFSMVNEPGASSRPSRRQLDGGEGPVDRTMVRFSLIAYDPQHALGGQVVNGSLVLSAFADVSEAELQAAFGSAVQLVTTDRAYYAGTTTSTTENPAVADSSGDDGLGDDDWLLAVIAVGSILLLISVMIVAVRLRRKQSKQTEKLAHTLNSISHGLSTAPGKRLDSADGDDGGAKDAGKMIVVASDWDHVTNYLTDISNPAQDNDGSALELPIGWTSGRGIAVGEPAAGTVSPAASEPDLLETYVMMGSDYGYLATSASNPYLDRRPEMSPTFPSENIGDANIEELMRLRDLCDNNLLSEGGAEGPNIELAKYAMSAIDEQMKSIRSGGPGGTHYYPPQHNLLESLNT